MTIHQKDINIFESFSTFKKSSFNFIDKQGKVAISFFEKYICCCCMFVDHNKKKEVLEILKDIDCTASDNSKIDINDDTIQLEVQDPIKEVQDPIKEVQDPIKEVQDPIKEVQDPIKEVQDPIKEVQDPIKEVQDPIKEVQDPIKEDINEDIKEYGDDEEYTSNNNEWVVIKTHVKNNHP